MITHPKLSKEELAYLEKLESRQLKTFAESQIGQSTKKKSHKPPCGCNDLENCRVCCMLEAHKQRLEGNTKRFEELMARATGMWAKTVIKKHGGRSGFTG